MEGAVQWRYSIPLHATPHLIRNVLSSQGGLQTGKSKQNIAARLVARNYYLVELAGYPLSSTLSAVRTQTKVLLFPVRELSGCIVSNWNCFKTPFEVETRETFSPQSSTPALHITAYQPIYEGGFCQNTQGHLLSHLQTRCSL